MKATLALLLALAVTTSASAGTGAADATKFDTSKLTVDDKNTLVVVISNYIRCSGNGVWPKIRVFYDQLLSEVDTQSASMAEAVQAVGRERNCFGTQWCAWATNHLQNWNDRLVEVPRPPPPPPPPPPELEPEPPPPVDLAYTAEGRAAFTWVSIQRHATVCPMARSQAFEMARKAMLARAGKDIDPQVMIWAGNKFDQEVGAMVAAGLSGEWCRGMTAAITTYQRMMFE